MLIHKFNSQSIQFLLLPCSKALRNVSKKNLSFRCCQIYVPTSIAFETRLQYNMCCAVVHFIYLTIFSQNIHYSVNLYIDRN